MERDLEIRGDGEEAARRAARRTKCLEVVSNLMEVVGALSVCTYMIADYGLCKEWKRLLDSRWMNWYGRWMMANQTK